MLIILRILRFLATVQTAVLNLLFKAYMV